MNVLDERIDLLELLCPCKAEHVGKVSAGRECTGHSACLVSDHHADTVCVDIIAGNGHEVDHVLVDGVHLGVELEAEYAVADIDERA